MQNLLSEDMHASFSRNNTISSSIVELCPIKYIYISINYTHNSSATAGRHHKRRPERLQLRVPRTKRRHLATGDPLQPHGRHDGPHLTRTV